MVWYTGVDKDIYESGIHFRPQQKYLTTDYIWPTPDAGGGGGSGIPAAANYVNQDQDNYSVYNPDPNRITLPTSYRPYSRNKALRNYEKFGETVGPNPDLYYPPTNKYVQFAKNLVPSWIKAGAGIVKELLPGTGATIRNEMLGQGFALDDIGRVVMQQTGWTTGPDGERTFGAISGTDPRNVMAGYNLTNISEEDMASGDNPFDKRIKKIQGRANVSQATKDKYITAIEAAKQNWLNANTNKLAIIKWKQKQKQDKRDKKIRKDLEGTDASLTDQDKITNILTTQQDDSPPSGPPKTDAWQETFSGTQDGGGEFAGTGQTASQKAGQSWEDSGFLADGGRVYLNLGGIASVLGREGLAKGGRIGFFQGALADTEEGKAMSPGTSASGGTHEGGYGRDDVPLGGGGEEPPTVVENRDVVDVDWLTTKPKVNINLDRSKYLAQLDLLDSLKNQELEGELAGTIGPVNFSTMIEGSGIGDTNINYGNLSAQISPNANINQISYNRNIGDWDLAAKYGGGQYNLTLSRDFKHGGLASLL